MTGLPACPAWCADHRDLEEVGPNPALAIHRTEVEPHPARDEDGEVSFHAERIDGPAATVGTSQVFLRVSGVDYGVSPVVALLLAQQATRAAMLVELDRIAQQRTEV